MKRGHTKKIPLSLEAKIPISFPQTRGFLVLVCFCSFLGLKKMTLLGPKLYNPQSITSIKSYSNYMD